MYCLPTIFKDVKCKMQLASKPIISYSSIEPKFVITSEVPIISVAEPDCVSSSVSPISPPRLKYTQNKVFNGLNALS